MNSLFSFQHCSISQVALKRSILPICCLFISLGTPLVAQEARREPLPQVRYELGQDSLEHDDVPKGRLEGPFLFRSTVIENTVRKYWISVPAQYQPDRAACVLVFQDGARAINPTGAIRVPQVLDNLIAKKKIPITIGIYITPGQRGSEFPESVGTGNPDNRDREYDVLDDKYARMLIEEILPEVSKKYRLTEDPAGRAIGGSSSGGICAFTVAWEHPEAFRNVISFIGSFTDIHGGHVYPQLILDNPAKPIRVFLQDGENDLRSPNNLSRDWHLQNKAMVAALQEKKYDMAYAFGKGGHSDDHGGVMLPEMLQWIWRDYPGVETESDDKLVEQARRHEPTVTDPYPGFDKKSIISPVGKWKWESNNNRFRSTQILVVEGETDKLSCKIVTTRNVDGNEQITEASATAVAMNGNKLTLDYERTIGDRISKVTLQGIVSLNAIVGWSMSEQNGSQRDTNWRAEKIAASTLGAAGLGDFETASDIGSVKQAGSSMYDPEKQIYELAGSGTNMWSVKDEFHAIWRKETGDFILDAQMKLLGEGVDPHRKLGWIIRTALETDSPYADATVHGDGLTSLQFRRAKGNITEQVESLAKAPSVVRLERRGTKISMRVAEFGKELQSPQEIDLDLGSQVYVGLFVCSHNPDVVEKGRFENVRITRPGPPDLKQYRDYLGSTLEIIRIKDGNRRSVYSVTDSMQAPNWTPDGKSLIYNRNGKLFRLAIDTRSVTEIDTGIATRNNNDHALSFDGKQLAISHHSSENEGKSMVYTLPANGGTPKLITKFGPSYLHCWSPDASSLLFTGQRNGELDIYRISASGGEEVALTNAKGVDDGSEFTPDGKTIYFNSNRTGRMQIWKMDADGGQQTQVTFDEYNNWFPHVSPDGRFICYLAYTEDMDSADHPFYKDVRLRIYTISGGETRTIAYLYGGQGTINVNSWSPDSEFISFVSNSKP